MSRAFRGTFTVLITPFSADGKRVDVAALRRLVDWQIAQGIHGLIPLGSTGEFLSVTREERQQIIETVVSQTRGRVPVLIGTGTEWTDEVVELSREAERMGADGVMIIPPFYMTPTPDELFEHYRRVGEAISVPIMVYNNPATANIDITPDLVARLARIDNVRYIKESTLEVTRVRDIIRLAGDRITVFAGVLGYESFWLGAQGWVAVCSNIIPKESAELFTLVADHQDMKQALALYQRILPIVQWVGGHRFVTATKAAFDMMGMPMGGPRAPRLPLPEHERVELRKALDELQLIPNSAGGVRRTAAA